MNPIAQKLLAWYDQHKRDLPWRRTRDPYHLWVSETMLQQTQVETVIPYYERFLARWPTISALAAAKLDEVLKLWEGLGYYARARNLHRGAQFVANELASQLPDDATALQKIPGIGRYTAGALASIAFNQDVPTVDGNIRRILCRLFAIQADPSEADVQAQLWAHAATLLPAGRAGDFNQALMDLGATICVPRRPRCLLCPLREECQAVQLGLQEQLPIRAMKKLTPHHTFVAGVVWKNGRVLIAQRKAEGLLGGLWEFPNGKIEEDETKEVACRKMLKADWGVSVAVGEALAEITHAFTHFKMTLHVFHCRHLRGTPVAHTSARVRWVWPSELHKFAWSAAHKKIVVQLTSHRTW